MIMTYKDIIKMDPYDLIDFLTRTLTVKMPDHIDSIEDMNNASKLLLKLSSNYSYICPLQSHAKIATRIAKRNKSKDDPDSTIDYEDMVDKKEIIDNVADCIKQEYNAISRAVTIKIESNRELQMTSR